MIGRLYHDERRKKQKTTKYAKKNLLIIRWPINGMIKRAIDEGIER